MLAVRHSLTAVSRGMRRTIIVMGSAEEAAPAAPAGPAIEPNLPTQRAALPAATAAGLIYLGATAGELRFHPTGRLTHPPYSWQYQISSAPL